MRSSGILMHISSLPSPWGIGTFGRAARGFVDFLQEAGQHYWQILPVGPTGFGDSPYQSFSTFAGNPYFIDLDLLWEQGLLEKQDYKDLDWGHNSKYVDFKSIYDHRFSVLRKAFARGGQDKGAAAFREENKSWLEDYALFMALKDSLGGVSWQEWDAPLRLREPDALKKSREQLQEAVDFWVYVQYLFDTQWKALKAYAREHGVLLIGDLPIYVSMDSSDVWAAPELFDLDPQTLEPKLVAGVPPDYFSPDGQLWGNPVYCWEAHESTGYEWWISRVKAASKLYDLIRIDHFRGFASYCVIPYGEKNARKGKWVPGPGMKLFQALEAALGELHIIAEDLGTLTPDVTELLRESGFPGMKVLEFAFDGNHDNAYLLHNHEKNCVVYTGTHDNDTVQGWWRSAMTKPQRRQAAEYLRLTNREGIAWGMVRAAWSSVADLAVAPIQDVLGLNGNARMNTPSTLGNNWRFRLSQGDLTPQVSKKLRRLTEMYGRFIQPVSDKK